MRLRAIIGYGLLLVVLVTGCESGVPDTYHYSKSFYRLLQMTSSTTVGGEPYVALHQRDSQNVTLGWHLYQNEALTSGYNLSLLHSVIYYGYHWDSEDYDAIKMAWETSELPAMAERAGTNLIFSAANYGALRSKTFFDSLQVQEYFIEDVVCMLQTHDADGLELDFPAVSYDDREAFVDFVQALYLRLKQYRRDALLYLTLPFDNANNAYDVKRLKPYVDLFIVSGNNDANTQFDQADNAPVAPIALPGNDSASVVHALKNYTDLGLDLYSMVLELPYYTAIKNTEYTADSTLEYYNQYYSYQLFLETFAGQIPDFDPVTMTSFITPYSEAAGQQVRVYFDDSTSLGAKYDWARAHGLRGVGFWALGFDYDTDVLWQMLDRRAGLAPNPYAAQTPFSIEGYFSRRQGLFMMWAWLVLAVLAVGLVLALLHWQARDHLLDWGAYQLYALLAVSAIVLWVVQQMGLSPEWKLAAGVLVGTLGLYGINIWIEWQKEQRP